MDRPKYYTMDACCQGGGHRHVCLSSAIQVRAPTGEARNLPIYRSPLDSAGAGVAASDCEVLRDANDGDAEEEEGGKEGVGEEEGGAKLGDQGDLGP